MAVFPSISVVIPSYNRADTIRRCLESVVRQTLASFEVIVVDDCSRDDTAEIVKGFGDPRVRCIVLDRNSGAQAARNRGIGEAKGDWIAFQDSDDEWLPEKLEKQVAALAEVGFDPWTVVHANAFWFDTDSGRRWLGDIPPVEGEKAYSILLRSNGPLFSTLLVSRRALEKIGRLDENVPSFQEWETSIRLAKYCRFLFVREPLFVYYLHGGETMSKNKLRDIRGYQYIIDKHRDEIINVGGKEAWESHLYVQLEKCLSFRLWTEADWYFDHIESRSLRYRFFQLLRRLHLTPPPVYRFRVKLT